MVLRKGFLKNKAMEKLSKFKVGNKAIIRNGRLKGEKVTVVGESNLNMEHRIIIYREKGRNRTMGFHPSRLQGVKMLNNEQIKLVQTAVRKAGIRTAKFDGRYRMLLGQYLQSNSQPVTSCKQLNNSQLDDFLAICEASGWRMPGQTETFYRDKVNKAGDIANFAQQRAIKYLTEDLGMTSLHLNNFIKVMTKNKCSSIVELPTKQAYKIIEGLKAMLSRKVGIKFNSLKEIEDYIGKLAKDFCESKGATDGKEQNQIG